MQTNIVRSVPRGLFQGHNFMTREFVQYRRGTLRGRTVYVEISKESPPYWSQMVGRNANGGPLYGITVKAEDGALLEPDPSRAVCDVRDFQKVIDALEELE